MPQIVLIGIGVVADLSDHKTGKVVHQTGRFHLEADTTLPNVSHNPVACSNIFNKGISRCDSAVVDIRFTGVWRIALNLASCIAVRAVRAGCVAT